MPKHTTLNLDHQLLEQAKAALGTSTMTETLHRALEEVINIDRRRRLLEFDLSELSRDSVDTMRVPREPRATTDV